MTRILVFGGPCSGKSTVSEQLGQALGVPVIHLDDVFWGPNWQEPDREEFKIKVETIARGDAWIVDSAYSAVRSLLLDRATFAVYLDVPLHVVGWRIIARTISRNTPFKIGPITPLPRQVAASGSGESIPGAILSLLKFARRFKRERRQSFLEEAERKLGRDALAILSTKADIQKFLCRATSLSEHE